MAALVVYELKSVGVEERPRVPERGRRWGDGGVSCAVVDGVKDERSSRLLLKWNSIAFGVTRVDTQVYLSSSWSGPLGGVKSNLWEINMKICPKPLLCFAISLLQIPISSNISQIRQI